MDDFPIDVVRSKRRKRTAQASLREGRIKAMIPDGLDPDDEERLVEKLATRVAGKVRSGEVDLDSRARQLAGKYELPVPEVVKWSSRQTMRWGSCTRETRTIRISSRLTTMPGWVLDSVLVHELAHLEVAGHGPDFQALVDRYELTERVKGYLIARSEEHHVSPPDSDVA